MSDCGASSPKELVSTWVREHQTGSANIGSDLAKTAEIGDHAGFKDAMHKLNLLSVKDQNDAACVALKVNQADRKQVPGLPEITLVKVTGTDEEVAMNVGVKKQHWNKHLE